MPQSLILINHKSTNNLAVGIKIIGYRLLGSVSIQDWDNISISFEILTLDPIKLLIDPLTLKMCKQMSNLYSPTSWNRIYTLLLFILLLFLWDCPILSPHKYHVIASVPGKNTMTELSFIVIFYLESRRRMVSQIRHDCHTSITIM